MAFRLRRTLRRTGMGLALLVVLSIAILVIDGWKRFGRLPQGVRQARIERSAQWHGDHFENPQPLHNDYWGMLSGLLHASPYGSPTQAVPVRHVNPSQFDSAPETGLRVTWLGHSTLLLEIDGHRVLIDPVWGQRASPFGWLGPARFYPPPLALNHLPRLDAVLISHDHYDHLDDSTIQAIASLGVKFIVPLGVGEHLDYWGVQGAQIVELDWWESSRIGSLQVTATPARHASGRGMFWGMNRALWAGFALQTRQHRVYYSGDTGLFPGLRDIGERLGPFDLTMIEIGAYNRAWPDWHLGPEQAVLAHQLVRGKVLLPTHWGLFNLAYHGWTEPIERALLAARAARVVLVAPVPGQSIEPERLPKLERWWPQLPFKQAHEDPIVATQFE